MGPFPAQRSASNPADRNPHIFAHRRKLDAFALLLFASSLLATTEATPLKKDSAMEAAAAAAAAKTCPSGCGNGKCDVETGSCECYAGWVGETCDHCGGKIRLNSTRGWLADAVGNYTVDSKCTWLIEATGSSSTIRLHLKEFATECGWDHLYVFDGDSVFSPMKAVFSGLVRGDRYHVQRVPEVVGTSGWMLLHFYSDVAYNMTGFNVTFSTDGACPSDRHELTCSGHGSCDDRARCVCDPDFKGIACDVPACPGNCRSRQGGAPRGVCDPARKRCDCFEGFAGESCSRRVGAGFVARVEAAGNVAAEARTSHAAVAGPDATMWVVAGETFSWRAAKRRRMVSALTLRNGNVVEGGDWRDVPAKGEKGPSPRYGHTAVLHERTIHMYGGTMRSGHVSKELWAFDVDATTWSRVATVKGRCLGSMCGPVHSTGHAAVVQSNRMIVIFGRSPGYGYLTAVQEYHFKTKEWSVVPTTGYPVRGGFGHSAAWDEATKRVYVFGGYVSTSSTSSMLLDDLYSYDPIAKSWTLLSSPDPRIGATSRYLHSAVVSRGTMLVFGGNTHNDTAWSYGAKCFSADLIAYDIACDRWRTVDYPDVNHLDLARFGHSAVVSSNGTILVHGGFNGVLKSDVVAIVPGRCDSLDDRDSCLSSSVTSCVWEGDACREGCRPTDGDGEEFCTSIDACHACASTSRGCVWCGGGGGGGGGGGMCRWRTCENPRTARLSSTFKSNNDHDSKQPSKLGSGGGGGRQGGIRKVADCPPSSGAGCKHHHACQSCVSDPSCGWSVDKTSRCRVARNASRPSACGQPCSEKRTCSECTRSLCMWCNSANLCTDRNAYLATFPYGQCMDWTTKSFGCPLFLSEDANSTADVCRGYLSCGRCNEDPSCGWCDDGSFTGLGRCLPGGYSGPMSGKRGAGDWVKDEGACTTGWNFVTCPVCQCNGHSGCSEDGKTCRKPCEHNTEGEHCQKCARGFFGNPVNGGRCKRCECNSQATTCHNRTGRCNCTTKGIVGDKCQKCDKNSHYSGDPVKDSCFYDLAIGYQFTFNLSKPEDMHLTAINFKNMPSKPDVDVDFSVTCSVNAKLNISVTYNSAAQSRFGNVLAQEEILFSNQNCSVFNHRFSKDNFVFGQDENTTFYVYIYDFEAPIWIIISFSQHPKLDLLQFFITFSVCFLALLLAAAILWKIKQKYDRYRRRQRVFLEMEQMASRPFGTVFVEMEKPPSETTSAAMSTSNRGIVQLQTSPSTSSSAAASTQASDEKQQQQHRPRRRKKPKPSPIALEPCVGNRAAVLSLIVRLPTGGAATAPEGTTGVAVASSLVTLGNPRKPSGNVDPKHVEGGGGDHKGRKGRKSSAGTTVDI